MALFHWGWSIEDTRSIFFSHTAPISPLDRALTFFTFKTSADAADDDAIKSAFLPTMVEEYSGKQTVKVIHEKVWQLEVLLVDTTLVIENERGERDIMVEGGHNFIIKSMNFYTFHNMETQSYPHQAINRTR